MNSFDGSRSPSQQRLVAFVKDARVERDIRRLASPRYDVQIVRSANEALVAARDARTSFLVAEHADLSVAADPSRPGGEWGGPILLEAARQRTPRVRRILLARAERLPHLLTLLHSGTADALVGLPLEPREFVAAITSNAIPIASTARAS